MSYLLGKDAKAYTGTNARTTFGTLGSDGFSHEGAGSSLAGLSELTNVRDLSLNVSTGEADVTTRGSGGWKLTAATLKDAEINFDMVYDLADTGFVRVQSAFFNNTTLPMAILSGSKTATNTAGLYMDAMVTKFEKSENLEDAQKVAVSVKPGYSAVAPEWIKIVS
jgi:hypothetical protein